MNELSNGHTVPTWYPIGLYRASPSASVRTPQPEKRRGPRRCRTTAFAFDLSTMPLQSRWPMFEVSESTFLPVGIDGEREVLASSTQ